MKKRLVFPKKLLLFILVILAVGGLAAWASIMCSSPAPKQGQIAQQPQRQQSPLEKLKFWEDDNKASSQNLPPTPMVATPSVATATPKPTPTTIPAPTATPTPFPTPTPQPGVWTMRCYNNMGLRGTPAIIRREETQTLNYNWGYKSPDPAISKDYFSCKWDGIFFLEGEVLFSAASDDGTGIWLDGQILMDFWFDQVATRRQENIVLPAGFHKIRVVYYDRTQKASLSVSWEQQEKPPPTPH